VAYADIFRYLGGRNWEDYIGGQPGQKVSKTLPHPPREVLDPGPRLPQGKNMRPYMKSKVEKNQVWAWHKW
jgi:hypothetical protein